MIYRMARDLETNLQARKFPVRVVYGPERLVLSRALPLAICVERDRTASESVGAPRGFQRNPRKVLVRELGVSVRLSAANPVPHARINEHEALCDQLVDAFLISLDEWATAAKAGDVSIIESRYLTDGESDNAERSAGVTYLLRFTIQRGVTRKDFDGSALREFTISELPVTSARVSRDGSNYEDV